MEWLKMGKGKVLSFMQLFLMIGRGGVTPTIHVSTAPCPPAKNVNLSQVLPYKAKMFLLNYSNTACSSSTQLSFVVLNVKL